MRSTQVGAGAGPASQAAQSSASTPRSLRLSRPAAFWAVALSFFVVTAFSTAPSSLYGIYEHREHLSSLAVTVAYAVYALGLLASLVLVGHVSDWYGRRPVLLPAFGVAITAAVVLLTWVSLSGLLVARVLTGLAVGAVVATATAFITDLDSAPSGVPTRRAAIAGTVANIGGLGAGPLIAGVLAQVTDDGFTLPYAVFLAGLAVSVVAVAASPEGHPAAVPRPRYRPQRLALPAQGRTQFIAATVGVFLCFAVFGLFAGLAGRFLAELGHPSPELAGLTIFLTFGTGVLVQTTTLAWAPHRLIAAGIPPVLLGLAVLVTSAWTSPPSLALFLIGGIVVGAGGGAIFRGSLTLVILSSAPSDRAGALATFFTAGYIGVSLPVLGLGIALEHVSSRVALLVFGLAVGIGMLAAAPALVRRSPAP